MGNAKQGHSGQADKEGQSIEAKEERRQRLETEQAAKGTASSQSPGLQSQGAVGIIDAPKAKAAESGLGRRNEPTRFDAMPIAGRERLKGYEAPPVEKAHKEAPAEKDASAAADPVEDAPDAAAPAEPVEEAPGPPVPDDIDEPKEEPMAPALPEESKGELPKAKADLPSEDAKAPVADEDEPVEEPVADAKKALPDAEAQADAA